MDLRPNLFIPGAAKAGTTSLASWLGRHPEIYLVYGKEPNFWSRDFHKGWDYYHRKHLKNYAGEKYILDANPVNMILPYTALRIGEECPSSKFIVCLREPWARAESHWRMENSWRPGRVAPFLKSMAQNYGMLDCGEGPSFPTEADWVPVLEEKGAPYIPTYIEHGMYGTNIKPFAELGSCFITEIDHMRDDFQSILRFLDLDPMDISRFPDANIGPSTQFALDKLPNLSSTYSQIMNLFKFEMKQFTKITDIDYTTLWGYDKL